MVTVVRTLNKTSFISLVLLLLGAWGQNTHAMTTSEFFGFTPYKPSILQKYGIVKMPQTFNQQLVQAIVTPTNVLAAGSLFATYQLLKVRRIYTQLSERYAGIRKDIQDNRKIVNTLIDNPKAQVDPHKVDHLNRTLLNSIKTIINADPTKRRKGPANVTEFIKILNKDRDSFPWATYFLPELLAEGINQLKTDLDTINKYNDAVNLAKIQQELTEQLSRRGSTMTGPLLVPQSAPAATLEQQFKESQTKHYKQLFFQWLHENNHHSLPQDQQRLLKLFNEWLSTLENQATARELLSQLQTPHIAHQGQPPARLTYSNPLTIELEEEDEPTAKAAASSATPPAKQQSWKQWGLQKALTWAN